MYRAMELTSNTVLGFDDMPYKIWRQLGNFANKILLKLTSFLTKILTYKGSHKHIIIKYSLKNIVTRFIYIILLFWKQYESKFLIKYYSIIMENLCIINLHFLIRRLKSFLCIYIEPDLDRLDTNIKYSIQYLIKCKYFQTTFKILSKYLI